MTKVNKMFKTITVFVAIAMLAALLPVSVAAENVVTIDAAAQQSTTDPIVVKGSIAAGNELTVLAIRHTEAIAAENTTEALGLLEGLADGKIMYIDQVTSDCSSDEEFEEFSFKLRNDENAVTEGGYLIVFMGGTDASAVHKTIELVNGAPEDLAFDAEASYTGNAVFTFTDDGAWKDAVEVTVAGAEDVVVTKEDGIIRLSNIAAGTYTVTFTAAGYYTATKEITIADRAAGTATLNVPSRGYYFDSEQIELTLAGGHADWADAVKDVITVTGDALAGYNAETGVITVDGVGNFTVEFGAIAGFAATEALTFEVKSYGQAIADAAMAAVTSAANAEDAEGLTWLITVPAEADLAGDFAGEYTFAWAIDPEVAPVEKVYTITRPAAETADADYALTLTVTLGGVDYTATKTFTVAMQGVDGYTVVAEDVKLTNQAFGITGAKVATIKIPADKINVATQTVSVNLEGGAYEMFYSPERTTSELVVFVGILRSDNDSTATVAAKAEIIDDAEGATAIYYGKVSTPKSNTKLLPGDVSRGLGIWKTGAGSYTDEQCLVADVIGNGTVVAGQVSRLLGTFKSEGSLDKSGFNILAN